MSDNVIETLKFNCTICPSECLLTVEVERDADGAVAEVRSVTGNRCPRGDKFAHQELTCPMRVLTTTVAVSGSDEVLLPVRTAEAIPLELHAQAMNLIRGLVVNAPIRMGDVVLEDLLDTSINLIASMDINRAQVANLGRGSFGYLTCPIIPDKPCQGRGVSQGASIKGTSLCAGLGIPWWQPSERMFHGTCR